MSVLLAVLLAYATVTLFAARRVYWALRDHFSDEGGLDLVMDGTMALLTGLLWPLILPVAVIMWRPRKTAAELQEEIAEHDRRIAELEREAGIGP